MPTSIVQRVKQAVAPLAKRMVGWSSGLPGAPLLDPTGRQTSATMQGAIPLRGEAPSIYQRTGTTVRVRGFEQHPVVSACVRAIVDIASAIPLQNYRIAEEPQDDGAPKVSIVPLGRKAPGQILVDAPSSFLSAQRLRAMTSTHFILYGNAFWFLERMPMRDPKAINTNPPIGIRVVHPEDVYTVYVNADGYPLWYLWRDVLGYPHTSPVTDIMHFRDLSGKGIVFGYPRMASALNDIIGDNEASEHVRQVVTNAGAPPAFALVNEETTPQEAEAAEARLYEKWITRGQRGRFAFLGGVKDIKAIGFNLRDLEFPDLRRVAREDICFAPGTLIYTARGVVPIEQVREGDRVLTHRGRYRDVKQAMVRHHVGEMRRMRGRGLDAVLCTPNHPWLADYAKPAGRESSRRRRMVEPQWIAADELHPRQPLPNQRNRYSRKGSHRLTMPHLQTDGARVDVLRWYPKPTETRGTMVRPANPRGTWVQRHVTLDEDFGWLFGLYLAEGSVGHNLALWYLNATEDTLAERATSILARLGVTAVRRPSGTPNCQVVAAHSQVLRAFFAQCGRDSASKHIPEWAMTAPPAFRRGMIAGYAAGDGHATESGHRVTTVSTSLAAQLRVLLWTERRHGALSRRKAQAWSIGGRTGNALESLSVAWMTDQGRSSPIGHADGYSAFPLMQSSAEAYDGPVYNLSVDEDESYVTVGGTVHNCAAAGIDPRMVGIGSASSDGGLSGIQYTEARTRLIQHTIEPMLRSFESELNLWLGPEFGDTFYRYDPDELASLVENHEATSVRVTREVAAGLMTVEEARVALDRPAEFEDDDTLAITLGVQLVPVMIAMNPVAALPPGTTGAQPSDGGTESRPGSDPDEAAGNLASSAGNDPNAPNSQPNVSDPPAETDKTRRVQLIASVPRSGLVVTRSMVLSPEQRALLWQQWDTRATSEEAPYRRAALIQFGEERSIVAGIFAKAQRTDHTGQPVEQSDDATAAALKAVKRQVRALYKPQGEIEQRWQSRFHPIIGQTYANGAEHVMSGLRHTRAGRAVQRRAAVPKKGQNVAPPSDPSIMYDFHLSDAHVQQAIQQRAARLAGYVGATTGEAITTALEIGMREGMSIKQLAKLIDRTAFGSGAAYRATMIARTESIGALSAGQFGAAKSSGAVQGKEWLTQGDDRVRESHNECEREGVIGIDDKFEATGMLYPGDPEGDAADIISCRCSLLYMDTYDPSERSEPVTAARIPAEVVTRVDYVYDDRKQLTGAVVSRGQFHPAPATLARLNGSPHSEN